METTYLTPADCVIEAFGGVTETSRAIGRDHSRVSRWRKPRAQGGHGGDVPSGNHRRILRAAKRLGVKLTANDLVFGREVKP